MLYFKTMQDMPKSVEKWYKLWINNFPESFSSTSLDLFYFFLSNLLSADKKNRNREWLRENIKVDSKKLSQKNIEDYCDIFEYIRDFRNVGKSDTAKTLLIDEIKKLKDLYNT